MLSSLSRFTGIEQSDEMMEFLWSNFCAAGGDHPSLEAWPTQKDYALHEVLLAGESLHNQGRQFRDKTFNV